MDKVPEVRAVVFRDEDLWIAQCLEYDLATQGRTLEQLRERVKRLLLVRMAVSQKERRKPFGGLPKGPQEFWELWESAEALETQSRDMETGDVGRSTPALKLRVIRSGLP